MWQNGIYNEPYRPGGIDRLGGFMGRLIGRIIPYVPYLFLAVLIYTPNKKDAGIWNATVFLVIAGLILLAERLLSSWLRGMAESGIYLKVGLWVFTAALLVLQIWAVRTALAHLLARWSEGPALSLAAAALFVPIVISRLIKTNLRPAQ
jgi:hypothetical protein